MPAMRAVRATVSRLLFTKCARIRAHDFLLLDTLTIASVLPGVGKNYRQWQPLLGCALTQSAMRYVTQLHHPGSFAAR